MDSYRLRVMNPRTILSEFYYVLKRFEGKKIRHFNPTVEAVKEELLNLLSDENELKFLNFSKEHYISVVGQIKKDNFIKAKVLTKILISDNFRYNNDLVLKIRQYLFNEDADANEFYNNCRHIDRMLGYLFTGFIDKGFSKETLKNVLLSTFIRNAKKPFKLNYELFENLSRKRSNDYIVYFKINISKLLSHDEIKTNNSSVSVLSNAPILNLQIRENDNPKTFLKEEKDNSFVAVEVSAHDSLAAIKIAKRKLYDFLDLMHLCFITEDFDVSDKILAIEIDRQSNQKDYWYGSYENKLDGNFRGGQDTIPSFFKHFAYVKERSKTKYESRHKISSSIRYFRLSSDSQEVEHKFLNYWIGLEYLFSNTDDPQSTIERVKKYLPAIQANVYLKRVIRDFHTSIIRLKATGITGFKKDDISYLLEESTYDEIWDKYYETLPLLAHRARKFKDIFFDTPAPKKISKLILFLRKHEEGLGQHLTRIYRVRNEIVHEAAVNIRTDIYTLTSNLKHYLLISLDTILEGLANNYGIDDINSFLIYQESVYENIKKEKLDLKGIMALNLDTHLLD